MSGPLEGVRALDLTRLLPGNYCTLLLADLGADVIKVEEPGRGDHIRWAPPLVDGEGAVHRALNRGKRSATVDLKASEGAAVLRRLVRRADAVVESYRPGVLDRLGVGFEALRAENERLVYCAITGYGQDGPYRDRAGHDIDYIGYAGILHATGAPDGPPVLPAVQVGDFGGGMAAALAIASCVGEAARTGRGRFVDVSMLDVAMSWTGVLMASYLATGERPPRGGMPLGGGLACYRVYRCADGKHLAVGALEPRFWQTLCEGLGLAELAEAHLDPDRQEEIASRIQGVLSKRTRDEWVDLLASKETCVAPVNDVSEAVRDPQVEHRRLVASVEGMLVGPGPAVRLADGGAAAMRPAPALGEHTEEILREAGFDGDEVAALRQNGVV